MKITKKIKKHYFLYLYSIIFLVMLVIFLTGGIPHGIQLLCSDMSGIPDGRSVCSVLLVFNIQLTIFCTVAAIAVTLTEKNRERLKWAFLVMILVLAVFIPVVRVKSEGGMFPTTAADSVQYGSMLDVIRDDGLIVDEYYSEKMKSGQWSDLMR